MKYLYEYNAFSDLDGRSRESEILSDMSSLFCDKIDEFVTRDPDWKRHSDKEKFDFIADSYDSFIKHNYSSLSEEHFEPDYLDELQHLLEHDKEKIINAIVKEVEARFYPA